MAGGPVVLLGQGEQYEDPEDWRELMRARRIRRGVEVAVRRDGLTTLRRPEEVPELAAVLDAVDPPHAPGAEVSAAQPGSVAHPATAAPVASTTVPPTPGARGATAPSGAAPAASGAELAHVLPSARPRKRWRFGVWRWVVGAGVLLLLRFCGPDGFGPLPGFGDRAGRSPARGEDAHAQACAATRGWLARAACQDPQLARLRPVLMRAYTARAASIAPAERPALAAEQTRWQASREACRHAEDPGACLEPRYRRRIAELGG